MAIVIFYLSTFLREEENSGLSPRCFLLSTATQLLAQKLCSLGMCRRRIFADSASWRSFGADASTVYFMNLVLWGGSCTTALRMRDDTQVIRRIILSPITYDLSPEFLYHLLTLLIFLAYLL